MDGSGLLGLAGGIGPNDEMRGALGSCGFGGVRWIVWGKRERGGERERERERERFATSLADGVPIIGEGGDSVRSDLLAEQAKLGS